jgi:hypothetical protein
MSVAMLVIPSIVDVLKKVSASPLTSFGLGSTSSQTQTNAPWIAALWSSVLKYPSKSEVWVIEE